MGREKENLRAWNFHRVSVTYYFYYYEPKTSLAKQLTEHEYRDETKNPLEYI